ncbi:MAG: hypothetical protein NC339_04360 [Muribaculaceae bacterium]|nr:hypothetical protein [Muribaculaceae bacterium]
MNKLLFITLSAALCAPVVAEAKVKQRKHSEQSTETVSTPGSKKPQREAPWPGSTTTWMPGTVTDYYWEGSAWGNPNTTNYTYDANGQTVKESTEWGEREYTYTAAGQVATEVSYTFDGTKMVPESKYEYTYDTKVPDYKVKEVGYSYINGQWSKMWESADIIERDAAGNVVKVQESNDGQLQSFYYTVSYGADGKANTITVYDEGQMEGQFTDIVWEVTDGQILEYEFDDEDFYQGANKIKSANVIGYEGVSGVCQLTASYPDTKGSFKVEIKSNGTVVMSEEYNVLDDNGSYYKKEFEVDFDYNETTGTWVKDGEYTYECTEHYDAYGLSIDRDSKEYSGTQLTDTSIEKGTVTYDPTYGYPTEYVYATSNNGGPLTNSVRKVFGNYSNSGISAIVADENATVEYYNLQGQRVASGNLTPGLYIRRQGEKAVKVMVR